MRDLSRAREAVKRDQIRMRHRLSKFLLPQGVRWTLGRKAWTQTHLEWLGGRRLEYAADQAVSGRRRGEAAHREPVGWLRCFRGIDTLTALALVAELRTTGGASSRRAR